MITKKSGYSPPQRLPRSPGKPWKDISVNSYDERGVPCETTKDSASHRNWTEHHVKHTAHNDGE
jgi:hypothetical protein